MEYGIQSEDFSYLHIIVKDEIDEATLREFQFQLVDGYQFIQAALEENETNRVLVHCEAGISRSTTQCIFYFMKRFGFTAKKAYDHIKSLKNNVDPNLGFLELLINLEISMQKNGEFKDQQVIIPSISVLDFTAERMKRDYCLEQDIQVIKSALEHSKNRQTGKLNPDAAMAQLWA
jgi:predicted protein tyrosine phosphatase